MGFEKIETEKYVYIGEYIDGKANGYGSIIYKDTKKTYFGNWKNDLYDGIGTYHTIK